MRLLVTRLVALTAFAVGVFAAPAAGQSQKMYKWVDERGKDFGIGRPYLHRDPPHVGPIDGQEYVSRRGSAKTQEAEAATKKKVVRVATRDDRSKAKAKPARAAKLSKTAKLSKGRTM